MDALSRLVEPCLEHLRRWDLQVRLEPLAVGRAQGAGSRPGVVVTHAGRRTTYLLVPVTSHVSAARAAGLIAAHGSSARRSLVCAPHLGPGIGALLEAAGLDHVDKSGNVHVRLDDGTLIHVEGKRMPAGPRERSFRAEALQVIFTLLAQPAAIALPVRDLGKLAAVAKSTAATTLRQLQDRDYVARGRHGLRIARPGDLRRLWLASYETTLRPRLFLVRCSLPGTTEEIAARLTRAGDWRWGGGDAGWMLTKHRRPAEHVIHYTGTEAALMRATHGEPSAQGPWTVLRSIGSLGLQGTQGCAHPLLVEAELRASADPRDHEVADLVAELAETR